MNIEILYPEYCNLYGDTGNVKYLQKCLPNANFIFTSLTSVPKFVNEKIDFLYIGPTTENCQEEIIALLEPYKKNIEELIENNTIILTTGNSLEIFGQYIEKIDGTKIEGLKIFNTYAKRIDNDRFNELSLGNFNDLEIVGFKNQLSHSYGENSNNYFLEMQKGTGINKETKLEGIHKNNFYGTYLLGPILPLNPDFTKHLLKIEIPYYEEAKKAYKLRLTEFKERA